MKTIIYISVYLLINLQTTAQIWSPVAGGTNALTRTLCVFNNELYAGGDFISAGGVTVSGTAKWNGTSWSAVSSPTNGVQFMIVYNNELYEGGSMGFSKWNGTNWVSVGSGGPSGHVYALEIYNNRLYVAGHTSGVFEWDGSTWNVIGIPNTDIYTMCSFNGELYVGGAFTSINGVPASAIAKWNGSSWTSVGLGVLGGYLDAMDNFNNELYVGGIFNTGAGNPSDYIMKWNGTGWLAVGNGASGRVYEIDSIRNKLYVGGDFSSISGVTAMSIANFDGSNWNSMGNGLNSSFPVTTSIVEYRDCIYASGQFTVAGDSIALHVASWCGSSSTGIFEGQLDLINVFPNPTDGQFTISLQSDNAEIIIADMLGQEVLRKQIIQSIESFQIDKAGVYIVYVKTNQGTTTRKLIVGQ